jgi:hypothetical protein
MQVGQRSHETATPILPLRESPVKLDDTKSCSRRLIEEMQFPEQLAESASEQGLATTLLRLVDENFQISESDPLLVLVVDISDNNSIHYANNGNYGLPAVALGSLPWPGGAPPVAGAPRPAGVAAIPPFAVGKCIAAAPNVVDLSNGRYNVFYVRDLESLHDIPGLIGAQPQFMRVGPGIAQMFGVAQHPQLVRFFTLESISGPPREYRNFNQSV